jgi:very-short-patch-repair endonuclease
MPARRTTPSGYENARRLRKDPTEAEARLWSALRQGRLQGISFRRQHAIGKYVVDFCSPRRKLIVELDGNPHRGSRDTDDARTAKLRSQGYEVLRFWDREVMADLDRVERAIWEAARRHR